MGDPSLATTPFQLSDANQFFELSKDPDIRNEYPNMRFENIEEAKAYLEAQIDLTENSGLSFFKAIRIVYDGLEPVYTEENNILVGFISLHKIGALDQIFAGGFQQTLGYAIKSAYRGKGLMTIALNMTLDAMRRDGYNVMAAAVKKQNISSIRVLEKCGFIMVRDYQISLLYVKRITMDKDEFDKLFIL